MDLNFIENLRKELQRNIDTSYKESCQRFSKHPLKVYGVRATALKQIGKNYWKEIQHLPKEDVFKICETLWQSGYQEEAVIACIWSEKLTRYFVHEDIVIFEDWLEHYVSNWAQCDTLCNHTVGEFIQ